MFAPDVTRQCYRQALRAEQREQRRYAYGRLPFWAPFAEELFCGITSAPQPLQSLCLSITNITGASNTLTVGALSPSLSFSSPTPDLFLSVPRCFPEMAGGGGGGSHEHPGPGHGQDEHEGEQLRDDLDQ